MKKVKYKLKLDTKEANHVFEGEAIIEDDIIKFINDGFEMSLDLVRDIFIREGTKVYIKYVFDLYRKTRAIIRTKEIDQELSLELNTLEINKEDNKYLVIFEIVNDEKIIIDMEYEEL